MLDRPGTRHRGEERNHHQTRVLRCRAYWSSKGTKILSRHCLSRETTNRIPLSLQTRSVLPRPLLQTRSMLRKSRALFDRLNQHHRPYGFFPSTAQYCASRASFRPSSVKAWKRLTSDHFQRNHSDHFNVCLFLYHLGHKIFSDD